MKCPNCGTESKNDAKFCGTCGTNLSNVTNQVVEQPQNDQSVQTDNMPEVTPQENKTMETAPVVANPNVTERKNNPINDVMMQPGLNNDPNTAKPANSKTAIFVAIGAIIVAIIAVVALIFFAPSSEEKKEKDSINSKFDPEKLIVIKKNDKYGYINSKGKVVLNAKYETASEFYNNHAVVRTEVKVNDITKSVYQIIDKKGKVKKQTEGTIKYLEESNMWIIDGELYNSSMKRISPEGVRVKEADEGYFIWVNPKKNTGGIMSDKGKITYTYKFQEREDYIGIEPSEVDESLKETYCRVNIENEKYAIVNCDNGKVVYDFTTKYVAVEDDNIFEINKPDSYDDESYIYFQNDKIAYKTDDTANVNISYYPGYLYIRDYSKDYSSGRYSYLHLDTMEIKSEKPANTEAPTDVLDEWEKHTGFKELYQNGKYGLSNNTEIVLPAEWERIEYLDLDLYKYLKTKNKNYVYAKNNGNWYLVSLTDKKAIQEFKASYIYTDDDTTFMYYTDKDTNNKKVYNLLSNKSLNVPSGTYLSVYSNYITVKDNSAKTLKYYNTNLELIYTENL